MISNGAVVAPATPRRQRWNSVKGALAVAGATLFLMACPKPTPPVVYPPDADAAPPASSVTCDIACAHVFTIPGAPSYNTCMGVCQPIQSPAFAPCINAAKTVTDINNCDH